jgi:Nitrous oxide-stimulated promoter
MNGHGRLAREKQTIELMVGMYCQACHQDRSNLCLDCKELLEYAYRKIEKCPFHELKPICANCRIHCYKGKMRERVKIIMRYSGPKMLLHHPGLALLHLMDRMRKQKGPVPPSRREEITTL